MRAGRGTYSTARRIGLGIFNMICADFCRFRIENCEERFCKCEFCHLEICLQCQYDDKIFLAAAVRVHKMKLFRRSWQARAGVGETDRK